MFPNLDFSYAYPSDQAAHTRFLNKHFDEDLYVPYEGPGSLVPHLRLDQTAAAVSFKGHHFKAHSLRELFSQLCLTHGISYNFILCRNDSCSHLTSVIEELGKQNTIILNITGKDLLD